MAAFSGSIQITGFRELDAALRALPIEVAGPIMEDSLAEAGEIVRRAAVANIHRRTGATAADIRVEVQNQPAKTQGVAGIGGTRKGNGSRAHVLRWLEFGTKPHVIVGGAGDRRQARKAGRALRSIGNAAAAAKLRADLRSGAVTTRRALKLPGGAFRALVHHPGMKNQSPLTLALADSGDKALKAFRDSLWAGIAAAAKRLNGRAI